MSEEVNGLKVGLEIHRQLDTKQKLFCGCPTEFTEHEADEKFLRRLRPTQSELGQVDKAALFEFHRGKSILYEADHETTCLVEMDEEPPNELNSEAIEICLTATLLMHANPVDEIHVMRKVVIDGSNTTGFQRTCIIALDGMLKVDGNDVPIQQISLEEDAARKTNQLEDRVGYKLDRLGVPLIEVSTAPVMHTPIEVEKVAHAIGTILRATGKVKRGLGSVRQDLNISILEGALVEIKGVQELELLSKVVELEVTRQQSLLKIRDELKLNRVSPNAIQKAYVDLTDIFSESSARVIRSALSKKGIILAVKLPNMKGLLGRELTPGLRLGTEMASRASFWGGVGGIFHSDELPAHGIGETELCRIRERLNLESRDAFVLVADEPSKAEDALDAVIDRTIEAFEGVPVETRTAMADATTRYMRPRPGSARMYPETDVPPTAIPTELIAKLTKNLPETPDRATNRIGERYSLNEKLSRQLVDSDYLPLFEHLASTSKIQASFIATLLTETCKSLERDGVPIHSLKDGKLESIVRLVDSSVIAKEAIIDLIKWQAKNPAAELTEGVKQLGLRMLTEEEVEKTIDRHMEKNRKLIEEKGKEAFSSLMGSVMSEVRGSAEPKLVTEILNKKLKSL